MRALTAYHNKRYNTIIPEEQAKERKTTMQTIREAREKLGISQEEVSRRALLSHPVIYRMETGKTVSRSSFMRVCQVLQVSPDDITGVKLQAIKSRQQVASNT